jgi:sugar phosphate isomerase/epimerase
MSEYRPQFVKELKKRIDDSGLCAYSVHALSLQFEPQLFSAHPRARQEAEDIFKQVLEAASLLEAKVYVFHGPANLKRGKNLVIDYDNAAKTAGYLADTAWGCGVKLAWENVHWCWYANPEFASSMLKYPDTKNLYFTLDLKQAAQAGFDPVQYIGHTAERLVNIHVCDYSRSAERGVYPLLPMRGDHDFSALKNALQESEYNGGVILEVYSSNYTDYGELEESFNSVKSFFE